MQEELNVDVATVGRILHLVITSGRCRPATVVEAFEYSQNKPGAVNLVVLLDGSNDGLIGVDQHTHSSAELLNPTNGANVPLLTRWETSVLPNHAVRAVRSWHWPRECANLAHPLAPFTSKEKEVFYHNHIEGIEDIQRCYACLRRHEELKK